MSFDQIEFAAKCIYKHKIEMINIVMEPIGNAFGVKKKPKTIKNKVSSKSKPLNKQEARAKEELKLSQLKLLGIGVTDI